MPRIDDLGLRADTAAGWAAAEVGGPATTAGENVWIDNDLVKCDGVTKVNDLPRAGSGTYAPLAADWATGAAFIVGQLVVNAGTLYRCTTAHTAGGSFVAGNFTALGGGGGSTVTIDADGTIVVNGITVEVGTDAEIAAAIAATAGTVSPAKGSDAWLRLHAGAALDALIVGVVTRDGNGAATSAGVVWPDGTTGTYTATSVSATFPGMVDAFTVTYAGSPAKTVTQSAVTRDAVTGAVTTRPAMAVA